MRTCRSCKTPKPPDQFPPRNANGNYSSDCTECRAKPSLRVCRKCRVPKTPDQYPPKVGTGPNAYALICLECREEFEQPRQEDAALLAAGRRRCTTCQITKPLDNFSQRSDRGGLYYSRCKSCVADASARHYRANEERERERAAAGLEALEADGVTTKKCGECLKVRSLNQFVRDRRSLDGLKRTCRDCDRAAMRLTREADPERDARQSADRHLRLYGIDRDIFEAIAAAQDNKCFICQVPRAELKSSKGFHTDHDHRTGAIRSLICRGCNVMLGNAQDDPAVLCRGAAYLEYFKTIRTPPRNSPLTSWLQYLSSAPNRVPEETK